MHEKRNTKPVVLVLGMSFRVWLLCSLLFHYEAYGNSNGAPGNVCDDMKPQHGSAGQLGPCPYKLTKSKPQVNRGEEVSMTMSGPEAFMGFLILVRKGKGDGAYGTWKVGDQAKTVDCTTGKGGVGVTQTGSDGKMSTTVTWVAPQEVGDYEVYFTVVKNLATFWSEMKGDGNGKITVTMPDPAVGGTDSTIVEPEEGNGSDGNHEEGTESGEYQDDGSNATKPVPKTMLQIMLIITFQSFIFF